MSTIGTPGRGVLVALVALAAGSCTFITRASVDTGAGDPNGTSVIPSISADGRFVAFESDASDLVPGDGNGASDVFVRDLRSRTTTRASVDTGGGDPNGVSVGAAISADGRYVAFYSSANDLVAGDGNGVFDVFVRDLQSATTKRVSVDAAGGNSNGDSFNASISADGRFVAFGSSADDLVAGDGDGFNDLFVRDLAAGTTARVSVDTAGGDPDRSTIAGAISGDGRFVTFDSDASDLVAGDGNGLGDVFVRDLQSGTTTRVSVDTGGGDANGFSGTPSISANGRFVAFGSVADDLVAADGNTSFDIFVRDRQSATTSRASVDTAGGDANSGSFTPSISGDGRYVAFDSGASDLVAGDNNFSADVFVRDRALSRTIRVSEDLLHRAADQQSSGGGAISADGRFVAFNSDSDELVQSDGNRRRDVFVAYARRVTVSAMTPSTVARGATNVPVTINGSGFEPGDIVQAHKSGSGDITLGDITVVNDGTITARLSVPADADVGPWDVRVIATFDDPGFTAGHCACLDVT